MKLLLVTDDDEVIRTWNHSERDFRRRMSREVIMMEIFEELLKREIAEQPNIILGES